MPEELIRMKIAKASVVAALRRIGVQEYTLSDMEARGLSLRVRKTAAVWCYRGRLGDRQTTWTIADATEMPDPDTARDAAREAWRLSQRGIDPREYLRSVRYGGPAARQDEQAFTGWSWETARDNYLADVLSSKAEGTHRDYRSTLNSPDLNPLVGRGVCQITPKDVQLIQEAILARGKRPQARHTTGILKACLNWVANQSGSGITKSPICDVAAPERSRIPRESGYVPTEEELGSLPWRLEGLQISAQTRIAGLLILLTLQRINTVITARREDFKVSKDGRGGIWSIPAIRNKPKRIHLVPLGPATWDLVCQALALGEGPTGWLFPQVRPRKAGGAADGHISYHPVAEPLHPLDPHDCRRGFATHGQAKLGMWPADTKAILDHAEGNSGDVTAQHYALHDGTHFKWPLMLAWEDYVLRLTMEQANPKGARLRTLQLPDQLPHLPELYSGRRSPTPGIMAPRATQLGMQA